MMEMCLVWLNVKQIVQVQYLDGLALEVQSLLPKPACLFVEMECVLCKSNVMTIILLMEMDVATPA